MKPLIFYDFFSAALSTSKQILCFSFIVRFGVFNGLRSSINLIMKLSIIKCTNWHWLGNLFYTFYKWQVIMHFYSTQKQKYAKSVDLFYCFFLCFSLFFLSFFLFLSFIIDWITNLFTYFSLIFLSFFLFFIVVVTRKF